MKPLKKILYVEDDQDIQIIVKVALEKLSDYELTVCSSGQEALDVLKLNTPDLLLCDVMMPEMDGPTLVEIIRKKESLMTLPFIYLTAKVHPNDIASLMSNGALSVITKPFNPVTLGRLIQKIWDEQ